MKKKPEGTNDLTVDEVSGALKHLFVTKPRPKDQDNIVQVVTLDSPDDEGDSA